MATINNELWFVAIDVCLILGLTATSGAGWQIRHLDASERNTITLSDGNRGNPNKLVISESGLYKLVMRSDKPQAKEFQNWVTKVVLPAIRKDGGEGGSEGGENPAPVSDLGVESIRMPGVKPQASH